MKEIRQIYITQKKKNIRDHFLLVGIAFSLLGALITMIDWLGFTQKH